MTKVVKIGVLLRIEKEAKIVNYGIIRSHKIDSVCVHIYAYKIA